MPRASKASSRPSTAGMAACRQGTWDPKCFSSSRVSFMSSLGFPRRPPGHVPGDLLLQRCVCNSSRAHTEQPQAPVPSFVCDTPRDLAGLPDRYSLVLAVVRFLTWVHALSCRGCSTTSLFPHNVHRLLSSSLSFFFHEPELYFF